MDSFKYGPRAAGMINAMRTGQVLMELSRDKKSVIIFNNEREFTSSQVKNRKAKTLEFALEILRSHPLERALNNWAK